MRLLENSWSEMLILDQIHQRMHNHLPDETTLANGQKFELLSLALLGVPSMSEAFNDMTSKLSNLKFDSADYVCLKFVLLLNPGAKNNLFHFILLVSRSIVFPLKELVRDAHAAACMPIITWVCGQRNPT